jgi:hypothetical protein
MRSFSPAEANLHTTGGDACTAKSVMNAYMAIFGHRSKVVVIRVVTCRSQKFQNNNTKPYRIIIRYPIGLHYEFFLISPKSFGTEHNENTPSEENTI